MQIPTELPQVRRDVLSVTFLGGSREGGLAPQGCNIFKKAACAAAVAACIATPNPVACILAVAPNCVDCL